MSRSITRYNTFGSLEDYEEYLKTTLEYLMHTTAGFGLRIDALIFQRIIKTLNKKHEGVCAIKEDIKPLLTQILVKLMILYALKYNDMNPLLPYELRAPQLYLSKKPNKDTVVVVKGLICAFTEFMSAVSCPIDHFIVKALDMRKHLAKSKLSAWKATMVVRLIPWMHVLIKQARIKKWFKVKLSSIIAKIAFKKYGINGVDVSSLMNKLFENNAFIDSLISVIIDINNAHIKKTTHVYDNIKIPICTWTQYILESLDKNAWVSINNIVTHAFMLLAKVKGASIDSNSVKKMMQRSSNDSIIMQLHHCFALNSNKGNVYINSFKAAIIYEIDTSCPIIKQAKNDDTDDILLDVAEEAHAMFTRGINILAPRKSASTKGA